MKVAAALEKNNIAAFVVASPDAARSKIHVSAISTHHHQLSDLT